VKKGFVGFLVALLTWIPLLLMRSTSPDLLKDSDTAVLLTKINEVDNPWKWFSSDWPLENHFYRPVSTLFFELDNHLHPGDSAAFGLTNSLLCCLCSLGVFWLVAELRKSPMLGAAAAWLFTCWLRGGVPVNFQLLSLAPILWILWRGYLNKQLLKSVVLSFGICFVTQDLDWIPNNFYSQTVAWIPGRTATSMTVFALIALASYVRFERRGAELDRKPAPSSTELPATRTTKIAREQKREWGWLLVSLVSTAIALGAYEQAVMIPPIIFLLGVYLRLSGVQTRFGIQALFWGVLVAYMAWRIQVVPIGASGYQKQQFRLSSSVLIDMMDYGIPNLVYLRTVWATLTTGLILIFSQSVLVPLFGFFTNAGFWISTGKAWKKPLTAILISALAFLPMAFLKQFGHYHFFPMALKTIYIISALEALGAAWIIAASPRVLQAPQRSHRAPGSLPHL
jgi:hypothetical protein